jgi:hypothetical protein
LLSSRAAFLRTTTRNFYQSLACFFPELPFIGLTWQGKDIVFRFIIECSSLRDFGPLCNIIGLFLYEDFGRLSFCMVKYLSFHVSSFALRYFVT